ncbi:hypothetical protein RU639_009463 [Aspergillus parasiticus]
MDMTIRRFITQGNYGMTISDTWSPPIATASGAEEPRPVGLGTPQGVPSDHRNRSGVVLFQDMLFGYNGFGQDLSG